VPVDGAAAQRAFFLAVEAELSIEISGEVELSEQKFGKTTPRKVGTDGPSFR
jgi:hypothetical protein